MIKFVVLGFLMYRNLTGYDIKQIMIQSTSNFMSASFGSIYPALNKLEKDGLVNSTQVIVRGKYKKIYNINDEGKEEFIKWLEKPINFMRSYEEILAKVFFYGYLPRDKAIDLIEKLIEDIQLKAEELQNLEKENKGVTDDFERSTLHYGIDHLRFTVSWYKNFLRGLITEKVEVN